MEKHPSFTGNSFRREAIFYWVWVWERSVVDYPLQGLLLCALLGWQKSLIITLFLVMFHQYFGTFMAHIYIYVCIHIHITCRYLGRPSWLFFGRFFSSRCRFKGLFSQQLGLGECHFAGIGLNHIYVRFVDLLICILINKTTLGSMQCWNHTFFLSYPDFASE